MNNLVIDKNFASFSKLTDLGIRNFCTWGNKYWGNMHVSRQKENVEKYQEILHFLNPNITKPIISLKEQHLDQIQIITKQNLHVIDRLLKNDTNYSQNEIYLYEPECDGIITKESIPLFKTVGDCSVIIITGIDKKDNKRFVAFLHSGLNGALLQIYRNALNLAHANYEFDNNELNVFIYPYISKSHFSWQKEDLDKELKILNINETFFELREDGKYYIDYGQKIILDLIALGVKEENIIDSNLCTFEENEKGNLFSNRYQKVTGDNTNGRYLVGVCL
jgi:copper oxidase (laccase) domain-containing protein